MKTIKKLFPAALALFLAAISALSLYRCRTLPVSWSVEENRALASSPALSMDAIWDGSYTQAAEDFYRDHIFARARLLKLDTFLQMKLLRRPVVRDVVLGEDVLLPALAHSGEGSDETLQQQADVIAKNLQGALDAAEEVGAELLYTLVPEQRTVYQNFYPAWAENPGAHTAKNREALLSALENAGIPVLDMTPIFSALEDPLPYYSRVDHHYTLKGAYLTYQAVCEAFGLPASVLTVEDAQTELLGTYSRKLYGLAAPHEAMQVLKEEFPSYARFDNGAPSDTPLIAARTSGYSLYADYMGGDLGQTVVKTNRPELPKILIVGDSFTNPLEALAVFDFDEMRSLDYRHFKGEALPGYIREYRPDYVLIVRDDVSCLATSGNGALGAK